MKVLVIGLGGQWKKYVSYFLKKWYLVDGCCKTLNTKKSIQDTFGIPVFVEGEIIDYTKYEIIVIALPPDIQAKKALSILRTSFINRMIIEIPVSFDRDEIEQLLKFENVYFFLEEYYTLFSKLLRQISPSEIIISRIICYIHPVDLWSAEAKKVALLHIFNNFLGTKMNISMELCEFFTHKKEDIYYCIQWRYGGKKIEYYFWEHKYLVIGKNKFVDSFHFDWVLNQIIFQKKSCLWREYLKWFDV